MDQKNLSELKSKTTEFILQTSTFKDILSTAATKIVALAKSAKSEADVVYAFDTVYLELLKNVLGLEFKPSKEESIDTVKMTANGRKSKKGRIDSRIGSVVIEFKHPSKLKSKAHVDDAISQTFEYLNGLNNKEQSTYFGFVTDGINAVSLRLEEALLRNSDEKPNLLKLS
ncbi:hypothetical protein, partial [Vibrio parahaemolyticus]